MPHRIIQHETIFYTVAASIASGASWLAALVFSDSTRWFFISFAVCTMTATFLSLRFRDLADPVPSAVGRGGLSIMFAIFGTRWVVYHFKLDDYGTDPMLLGLLSMIVCTAVYFVGMALLVMLDTKSSDLGKITFDLLLAKLGLQRKKEGDEP